MLKETKDLTTAFDTTNFRVIGHQLIDLIANHLDEGHRQENSTVYPHQTPEESLAFWQKDFVSKTDVLQVFGEVLARSINVHHPRNMGHQVTVPALVGGLAGMLSDVLSNGNGVYEMGIASNAIERIITDLVAKQIGYDEQTNGLLTSGGTLANLTALLAARQAKAPQVWEGGHQEKLAIMVSEEAHYCIDRAARIMGFGKEGIIKVPVDEHYKIRIDLLEDSLAAAQNKGYRVIALIGCASSTSSGAYEDLAALGEFSQKHQLWFHVDAAHGGGVIFSKKYQHLVKGIAQADSVVIDFHKMLLTPALSTGLIFKNSKDSYQTFHQRAQYLWDSEQGEEWYNSGKRTFECTKFMMSLKIYAIIKEHGLSIFEQNVDHLYDMAKSFAQLIQKRPNFELAVEPEANIVNFRYLSEKHADSNALNEAIRREILVSGQFYIVQTMLGDTRYLRTTLMNPLTTVADLEALLDEVERIGEGLE